MLTVKEINEKWFVLRDGVQLNRAGINHKSEAVSIAEGMRMFSEKVEVIEGSESKFVND